MFVLFRIIFESVALSGPNSANRVARCVLFYKASGKLDGKGSSESADGRCERIMTHAESRENLDTRSIAR